MREQREHWPQVGDGDWQDGRQPVSQNCQTAGGSQCFWKLPEWWSHEAMQGGPGALTGEDWPPLCWRTPSLGQKAGKSEGRREQSRLAQCQGQGQQQQPADG